MIYDQVRLALAGDRHVLAMLGDDASLETNFKVLSLTTALDEARIAGVTDLVSSYNSILVQYDYAKLSHAELCREIVRLSQALPAVDDIVLPSRLVIIPVFYLDPWTKACIEDYRSKVASREYDPTFVARVNGLSGADAVVVRHSGCEHWVVTVSSFPGLPILRPLDPKCAMPSLKYNPPRTWTPVGAIGVGGTSTSIYTIPSPGGYNLIGRTPVPVWDPAQSLPAFQDSAILLRAADRVRFVPIGRDEYDHHEAAVQAGTYEYEIHPGTFAVRQHRDLLAHASAGREDT